ncbi:MAG: amidohydrolase family protein [Bacteroidia bacterium]
MLFLLISISAKSQQEKGSLLLENVIIHSSDGVIENGVIGIYGDSIVLAGDARVIKYDKSKFSKIENVLGAHAWPGFFALNSTIGLTEIDAVRATLDYAEVGSMKPHVRSLTAFNTDSKIIPTVRSNGVIFAQSCPQGGVISGSSSVFRMYGWNWEDAVFKADDGMHINWPSLPYVLDKSDTSKKSEKSKEFLNELNALFRDAVGYSKEKGRTKKNLLLESLQPILKGEAVLFLHANKSRDIQDAIIFAQNYSIKRAVIVGCDECESQLALLKEKNIPVILSRVHRLPDLPDMPPEKVFSLPSKLQREGILVALCYEGGMEAMGNRNLPFTAGTAASYGLSDTEALNMISLNSAKILGLDDELGSIEAGKKASFFLSDGNALDMRSGGAKRIWMDGIEVSVDNSQKQLYLKYMNKYGLE